MLLFAFVVAAAIFSTSNALYPSSSEVVELTPSNFDKLVVQSDDVWIVEFFAPWCGHCQSLVPEYSKAAKALKGVVKVGAVDADAHKSLGSRFGVSGFPTLKVFGSNKNKPEDYRGARTAQGLVDAGFKALRDAVDDRLGGKRSGGGGSSGGSGSDKDVIELTDSNFASKVLESEDLWLVEFFAPWCGHCKNLAPHWAKAATELKGKVKVGALDATAHTYMASKYGVQGYPTIKIFNAGKKDSSSVEDYNGGRTASDIVNFALDKLAENIPPPEVKELSSNEVLKEACGEHPLCVVSVLPHILDCQSKCRNEFIDMLKDLGDKYKKKMWGWVWTEAGKQPALEDGLEIGGFGYPAMAVVNAKKMKFSILRGSFSADGINEFLRDLSYGRGSTAPLRGAELPKIEESEPWDGKDGALPVEDDIDLSDVSLDDKDEL
ncbi:protein disulfide-isomerase A6 homolog [Cloeon dipterum]|uniref:protein disulfide-isomerase A6 homolog n=1 Tax=Cloeon dipterum TaxID=197152 RepID=UPI00321F8CCF